MKRSTLGASLTVLALLLVCRPATAADMPQPGAGNARAATLAHSSPLVMSAMDMLQERLKSLRSTTLRAELDELMHAERACIRHRAGLGEADKQRIVDALKAAGLVDEAEGAAFPGGLMAGIFPPVSQDGSRCPRMPQPFYAAPGGANGGHHSEPGGLPVHEAFNDLSALSLADNYDAVYGQLGPDGLPIVVRGRRTPSRGVNRGAFVIDSDIVAAAPIWHDWAKTLVFQWNADGTEFPELNFGGNGKTDNQGQEGNSKTGAHHILGLAEAMKRGMPPDFVVTVASAHAVPTYGGEYKVVNWLRAAAILAGIDPYARGYLRRDALGVPRLPAVRALGEVDLNAAPKTQPNVLVEYILHNLSDADFNFTGPAAAAVGQVIDRLAPEYGHTPQDADYLFAYRHPVLSYLSAERLFILYSNGGLDAVRKELNKLKQRRLI
ncbi:hypothetical protein [Paludibacterium purpuratum]|uniref:Uncharacterized protein n=1 Tax=Paludibacterium purpuratum TaxID=1144873 RepID=A0A4R7B8Y2_9NEIS|nr:hypothetical protein [Paludibacterium purpuratum]TDR80225.1 hypothetical protein DFP86_10580 [Paludibacterium purpuratum]